MCASDTRVSTSVSTIQHRCTACRIVLSFFRTFFTKQFLSLIMSSPRKKTLWPTHRGYHKCKSLFSHSPYFSPAIIPSDIRQERIINHHQFIPQSPQSKVLAMLNTETHRQAHSNTRLLRYRLRDSQIGLIHGRGSSRGRHG